jgi:hypothetical protein
MSISHLKLLAIVTMVIDHVGLFFFPEAGFLRIIGRLAFPIFGWLIANGAYYTRDIKKYMGRLLLLAVVSQVPFALANGIASFPFSYLNVVFTLFLGLAAIWAIQTRINSFLSTSAVVFLAVVAHLLNADYGAFGVIMIVLFYVFYTNKLLTVISQSALFLLPTLLYFYETSTRTNVPDLIFSSSIEIAGIMSLAFILTYDSKPSPKFGRIFYYFYPIQYVLIYLFQVLLH